MKYAKPSKYDSGCLTCGKECPPVTNYGMRYVCPNCQKFVTSAGGASVTLRSTGDGRHIKGKFLDKNSKNKEKINLDDLRVFNLKCYATFAGDKGPLIVLLDEEANDQILKF